MKTWEIEIQDGLGEGHQTHKAATKPMIASAPNFQGGGLWVSFTEAKTGRFTDIYLPASAIVKISHPPEEKLADPNRGNTKATLLIGKCLYPGRHCEECPEINACDCDTPQHKGPDVRPRPAAPGAVEPIEYENETAEQVHPDA